MLVGWLYDRDF